MARRDVTGVLLVGGASRRFGTPKALALLDGEPLAVRAHRVLSEAFDTVIAVGKTADALPLPFPVVDDGSDTRAAMVGVAAGLRSSGTDVTVVLPVDMPLVTPDLLVTLAAAAAGADAAIPRPGPLPGAYRRSALPVLERRIETGDLALHRALAELDAVTVELDESLLRNVNAPEDLPAALDRPE